MKKKFTHKSDVFNTICTYTIDENLNKFKGKVANSKKLAEANEALRKLKTPLPK